MTSVGRSRVRGALVVTCLACLTPSIGMAQEGALGTGGIKGMVRDSLGLGIMGVQIALLGSPQHWETDDKGAFLLHKVPAGPLSLHIRRLGFRPDTVDLMVLAGKTIPLDITIDRVAIALTPVVINGRAFLTGWRVGYYNRRELGIGHFYTREDLERRNPAFLTDMFRMVPGARVEPSRGLIRNMVRFRGCRVPPLVWLDGTPLGAGEFDLDALSPRSIEAMEIYSGTATVPTQFMSSRSIASACGTIVVWSREGELRQRRRPAGLSAAAVLAQMVDSQKVYTAKEVDVAARPDSTKPVRPLYPDALHDGGIPGSVMAEFVVDPTGEIDVETFSVVFSSHPAFSEAVQRALKDASYIPAMRQGYPVAQVVQHEFKFVPEAKRK
jgi:hypothetical protein